jgi:prephenate dehydrogenase
VTGDGRRLPVVVGDRPPAPEPIFQRAAFVGLRGLGASMAMAMRQAWPASLVIGVDDQAAIEAAIRTHAVDVGADDLVIAAEADLVVLCAGPDENARALPYLADAVIGVAVVLIVGAVTAALADAARVLPGRFAVVAAVPELDQAALGPESARTNDSRGLAWALVPLSATAANVERVRDFLRALRGDSIVPSGEARAV